MCEECKKAKSFKGFCRAVDSVLGRKQREIMRSLLSMYMHENDSKGSLSYNFTKLNELYVILHYFVKYMDSRTRLHWTFDVEDYEPSWQNSDVIKKLVNLVKELNKGDEEYELY